MGQAKRRGTLEERTTQAEKIQAEISAWEEYYEREKAGLDRGLQLSPTGRKPTWPAMQPVNHTSRK